MSAEVEATKADPTTESKAEEVKPVDTTTKSDEKKDVDSTEASTGADREDDKSEFDSLTSTQTLRTAALDPSVWLSLRAKILTSSSNASTLDDDKVEIKKEDDLSEWDFFCTKEVVRNAAKESGAWMSLRNHLLTTPNSDNSKTTADDIDAKFSKGRKDGDRNGGDRRGDRNGDDRRGGRGGRGRGGNRGRGNSNYHDKFDRSNVKSRYDDQEATDDPAKIRKQVEFYFSDTNLRQDKFLFERVKGSKNEPVDIKIIASFKRMQRFQPYTAIVNALKESTTLNVLNADKPNDEQVQRKEPLPEDLGTDHREVAANYAQQSMHRSIYAKGFGEEDSGTQLKIEELFSMWGVTAVRLRRLNDGHFKGSAFIEFPSEDEMQQFLELDEESKPKWEGKALQIMSKKAYCEKKDKDINEGKIRPNDQDDYSRVRSGNRDTGRGRGRGRGGRGRGRGDRDDRDGDRRRRSSRSKSHDLREDDWKELRKRDSKRDSKKDDEKKPKQEFEEKYVDSACTC